jgi:hypothetical protein
MEDATLGFAHRKLAIVPPWRPWAWPVQKLAWILTKLSIEQGQVLGDLRISACHRLLYGGAEFAPIHVTLAHKM